MNRLDKLPEIANRQMSGLEATPTLLCKIKLEAAEGKAVRRYAALRPVLAACAAVVLCVGAVAALDRDVVSGTTESTVVNMMASRSAGTEALPTAEPRTLADVPKGAISMSAGMKRSAGSLFAQSESTSFPLITIGNATYRMLEKPDGISDGLLGIEMGKVTEFNIEPALGSGGVVSNAVACGDPVYAVGDLSGALVAAPVNGSMRVFQRVSYAGAAVIGRETLADTLCAPSDVAWMQLDGLGRVDDPAQAQQLMEVLLSTADYQSTAFSGDTSMQIGLHNGITLQLMAGEDSVSACGTWSCPDFFEAFQKAVR